jgi:hypothetical protein
MIMILYVHVVCIHAQSRITALESKDIEIKNEIETLQDEHRKLHDAYTCLDKEKLKWQEKYNCREKELQEVMDEAKASGLKWVVTLFANFFTPGSSKGSTKAALDGQIYELVEMQNMLTAKKEEVELERAKAQSLVAEKESLQKEVDGTKSKLLEMQTKLTAKDEEVVFERANAQSLQEKLCQLQSALEQQRLQHDAEMQHQSAETAEYTSSEAQHTRCAEHVVTDAGGQQAGTINDSSVGQVTESQLNQTKSLEQDRDYFRGLAGSLKKELHDLRYTLVQLGSGMKFMKIGERRNDEICPSGASTQAETKTDL